MIEWLRSTEYVRVLKQADFRTIWLANVASLLGDHLHFIAIMWLVIEMTGSGLSVSFIMLSMTLPGVLFRSFSGVLVDLWDRKRVMIAADLLRMGLVGLIPLLHVMGVLAVWNLMVVSFLISAISTLFGPAMQSTIPNLLPEADLVTGNSLLTATNRAMGITGTGLGGVLVASIGPIFPFYLDMVSFLVSAGLLARLHIPHREEGEGDAPDFKTTFVEGYRYTRQTPLLWTIMLMAAGATLAFGPGPVLLAVLADEELMVGAAGYGALNVAADVGLLVAVLVLGQLGSRIHRGLVAVSGYTGMGIATVLLGLAPNLAIALGVAGLRYGLNMIAFIPQRTLLQTHTPDKMRGRVFGFLGTVAEAPRLISLPLAGWLIDVFGARIIYAGTGIWLVLVGIAGFLSATLRKAR